MFVFVKVKRVKQEKEDFDLKCDASVFSPHVDTRTEQHRSAEGSKCLSKDSNPNTVPVPSAGAKGLKSHQPLKTVLLRLNWPEPLHIKLQKNSSRRRAGGGD